jgi:hypothetical protein
MSALPADPGLGDSPLAETTHAEHIICTIAAHILQLKETQG